MLQGKYIKYTKDITLEIFTKIIERLNKAGWKHISRGDINTQFDYFNECGYLVYSTPKNEYSFYSDYVLQKTDVELKVSDILGADWDIDKPQFEVGKWYKWLWKINNKITYGKINFVADGCFDVLEGVQNDIYSKINGYFFKDCTNIELLTDLSEIQQYLPDGHPDKLSKLLTIGDLVEGEVYYCLNNTICKWGKNDSTHSINIEKKDFWYNESGGYTGQYGFRLATTEEKHWLNVCISEGKFIEKEVALRNYDMYGVPLKSEINEIKQQFKVGDWVYADKQSDGDFRHELGNSYIPIFKVEEIYKPINKGEWLRPVKDRANGVESKYCRLATPEEIAKVTKPETKESKEMQLSDLKNPVFNIGDRVRVIANSLTEFNSSWMNGNNANYKKDYIGVVTGILKSKSSFCEVDTWYYLDDNESSTISCNLLELVEPVKKEFDRNWYVEVNSQEEVDKVFDWLESQGEKVDREWNEFSSYSLWKYIVIHREDPIWVLTCGDNCYNRDFIEKQLSDILPEYKQSIRTKAYHIIDTNEDLRNEIQSLINQRDFKSSDFVEPIIIKSKKQKRNKLIIVNN